jgi:hypothetical protein
MLRGFPRQPEYWVANSLGEISEGGGSTAWAGPTIASAARLDAADDLGSHLGSFRVKRRISAGTSGIPGGKPTPMFSCMYATPSTRAVSTKP